MAVNAFAMLVFALYISQSSACVHVYGDREEAAKAVGGHYTYSYNGLDWAGSFPQCRGQKQSPVMLPGTGAAARALQAPPGKASFSYGTLANAVVVNNGHTLQVALPPTFQSEVLIPVKGDTSTALGASIVNNSTSGNISYVRASPTQFHFHTHSEHVVSGALYPLEMHIVHFIKSDQLPACGDIGCPVVLGLLLALTTNESRVTPALRQVVTAMPLNEGENNTINGTLDVNALLPQNRAYFTYEGSLTTPPCTEGILWNVLATPMFISQSLLNHYQEAVGSYLCPANATAAAGDAKTTPVTAADGPSDNDDDNNDINKDGKSKDDNVNDNDDDGDDWSPPPPDASGCVKLADGHNYRAPQPLAGRSIMLAA